MPNHQLINDFITTKIHFLRGEKVLLDSDFSPSLFRSAFTEQDVAMLSGLLNSKREVETNIAIMRTLLP